MSESGLRQRKKARTARHIADTAARMFGERGYENVAIRDVAREAEVAEQTIYNYFPTKETLVTDRDPQIRDTLCELIRDRPAGISPPMAIRGFVLASVDAIRSVEPDVWRGELGYLSAISPSVHRLALQSVDRLALAVADAINDTSSVSREVAQIQGIALAGVIQIILTETGRRTRAGESQTEIADRLYPRITNILDELDRWFDPVSDS